MDFGSRILTSNNSRETWKFINATTFRGKGKTELPLELEQLNKTLADIVQAPRPIQLVCPSSCDMAKDFSFRLLTEAQIYRLLSNLKTNTATGPDGIPASLLKDLAPIITPSLTRIFNASLLQQKFQEKWKQANVCPVYKAKGSKTDPSNYRPISILPVLARTFEKAIAAQLYDYCDAFEISHLNSLDLDETQVVRWPC